MRFKKYLKEGISGEEIISILQKDCGRFISILKKSGTDNFIYRGVRKNVDGIKKITPRKDRTPRYVVKEIHEYMDEKFQKTHGFKARSQGVFTSAEPYWVGAWGDRGSYLFFPIKNFKYVWYTGNEMMDFYGAIEGYSQAEREYKVYKDWLENHDESNPSYQYRKDKYDALKKEKELNKEDIDYSIKNLYKHRNLEEGIRKQTSEIIFYCPNDYYLIDTEYTDIIKRKIIYNY